MDVLEAKMIQSNYSGQDCAELHSPYENLVVASKNSSPQVILHEFLLVTMRVLNSYDTKIILTTIRALK